MKEQSNKKRGFEGTAMPKWAWRGHQYSRFSERAVVSIEFREDQGKYHVSALPFYRQVDTAQEAIKVSDDVAEQNGGWCDPEP